MCDCTCKAHTHENGGKAPAKPKTVLKMEVAEYSEGHYTSKVNKEGAIVDLIYAMISLTQGDDMLAVLFSTATEINKIRVSNGLKSLNDFNAAQKIKAEAHIKLAAIALAEMAKKEKK